MQDRKLLVRNFSRFSRPLKILRAYLAAFVQLFDVQKTSDILSSRGSFSVKKMAKKTYLAARRDHLPDFHRVPSKNHHIWKKSKKRCRLVPTPPETPYMSFLGFFVDLGDFVSTPPKRLKEEHIFGLLKERTELIINEDVKSLWAIKN